VPRHNLQPCEPALDIKDYRRHAGRGRRRVLEADAGVAEHEVRRLAGHESRRRRSIPECQGHGAGESELRLAQSTLIRGVVNERTVATIQQTRGLMRRNLQADHATEQVARLFRENLRRPAEPCLRNRVSSRREEYRRNQHREDGDQPRRRPPQGNAGGFPRRDDHFGRGYLASLEIGGQRIAAGQSAGHGEDRRRAILRLLLQASQDDPVDHGIDPGGQGRRQRRRLAAPDVGVFRDGLGMKGGFPGEELVEHQAHGVDVAADGHLATGELLRGHVGRRARAELLRPDIPKGARQAEVGDNDLPAAVEHDVSRLEITVQNAPGVRRGQAGAELPRDVEGLVLR